MNYFKCCHHCVAPKRYPGCSGKCPEYKKARAKYDADMAVKNKDIQLKYYANEKHAGSVDGIAKYARRRPRNWHAK